MSRSVAVVALVMGLVLATAPPSHAAGSTSGFASTAKSGACFCGLDTEDAAFCFVDDDCDTVQACLSNDDCPAGTRCLVDTCCDFPKDKACLPVAADPDCQNPGFCDNVWTTTGCEPPLFVQLESFEADVVNGVVQLYWTTSSETENVGFRLLRARGARTRMDKLAGEAREVAVSLEMVTSRLIPAQGDELQGASYRFSDAAPQRPGVVYYFLEDTDVRGKATLHGPVRVVIPAPATRRR